MYGNPMGMGQSYGVNPMGGMNNQWGNGGMG